MGKYRIAIIGCNNMGKKHLAVLREYFSKEVEVVGILNSSPESTEKRAKELSLSWFKSLEEITPETVDGAIVSTPAVTHASIGKELLKKGIPCLIEKPLGTTQKECEQLIKAGREGKAPLLVGHLTSFDPAVIRLKQELKYPIKKIRGIRISRNAENKTGISAVQELMIHDLAIIYSLLGNHLSKTELTKDETKDWENHAVAKLEYADGAEIELEALRENIVVRREMEIEDVKGNHYHLNFMKQSLAKNGKELTSGGNCLANELANFIGCINKTEEPKVSGEEAKEILDLCLKIESKIPEKELQRYFLQQQNQKSL